MKNESHSKNWRWLAVAAGALTLSATPSWAAADFILNTFDSAAELTATDNDWSGGSATWDGTTDAGGGAGTGSLHVSIPYSNPDPTSWQETQVQRNIPWPYIGLGAYAYIEYDLKVDTAHSGATSDGTWGMQQPIIQQWDWTPMNTFDVTSTGWIHVKQPLAGINTLAHLVMDFHAKYGVYTTNTISYWIDNVKLTVPPAAPPTVALERGAKPGLNLFAYIQSGADGNQREGVSTVGSGYGWYGAAGDVTYSITITDYPKVANFGSHIFWVAGPISSATRSDVDWHEATVLRLDIGNTAAGNGYSNLRFKTNAVDSNGDFYGAGNLPGPGSVTVTGTWTVTFQQNTNVIIKSPGGAMVTNVLPAEVAAQFNAPIFVNIGAQPGDAARATGEAMVISAASITGAASSLNTAFASATLDSNWEVKAAVPAFALPVPPDASLWVRWTLPDNGFFPQVGNSLTGGTWNDLSGTVQAFGGDFKRLLVRNTDLPAGPAGYFRLIKRGFSKLQVLLPGETAAPGTPTGKTGTPFSQLTGLPFNVTINAVDEKWRPVAGVTDTVHLTCTDGSATLPADTALSGGSLQLTVTVNAAGTWSVSVSDVTDLTKGSDTSSNFSAD